MNKLKSRETAYGILLIFGSLIVLMAIWQLPDEPSSPR
jgi:hypothetical protein